MLEIKSFGTRLRSAYFWNTAGSLLNAFQSVIMLTFLTRACDLSTAGIFTLAYANANLFLTMGTYGMRSFEASDVGPRYSFKAYGLSRVITCVAMVLCSWSWLAWSAMTNGYTFDKVVAVALMTLMKGLDAVEDVFDGSFQRSGRLDVAGRQMTLRVASTTMVFCATIVISGNLINATLTGFIWSLSFLVLNLAWIKRKYMLPEAHIEARFCSPWPLLAECFPLFLVAFLLYYVGNAPKYAIDSLMNDSVQAIYGFIAMPVFVVSLMAQFIYMPLVQPLSEAWAKGERDKFIGSYIRQALIIVGVATACVVAAAVAGPPILGLLYNCDLSSYQMELCLLMIGGGLLAVAMLFTMGITVMRRQRLLTPGYVFVALIALLASGPMVEAWGIDGAACCYVGCMGMLAVMFGALFMWCARG